MANWETRAPALFRPLRHCVGRAALRNRYVHHRRRYFFDQRREALMLHQRHRRRHRLGRSVGGGLGCSYPVGFSAHTRGESASVAPRPKPSAAARLLPSHGWRLSFLLFQPSGPPVEPVCPAGGDTATERERIARQLGAPGDRRLSGGLIRCNLASD